jgi:hypothetical protein
MATALVMKDTELRGLILQAFYDRRQTRVILRPSAGWIDSRTSDDEVVRIREQLGDHGLLDWHPDYEGGAGSITAYGVDVVEGQRSPDIAVQLVQHDTTNISNSTNVVVGNNNSQAVVNAFEEILRAIEASSGDAASKAQSKSLLSQLASSPVIAQIIGQATKFGLGHFN